MMINPADSAIQVIKIHGRNNFLIKIYYPIEFNSAPLILPETRGLFTRFTRFNQFSLIRDKTAILSVHQRIRSEFIAFPAAFTRKLSRRSHHAETLKALVK